MANGEPSDRFAYHLGHLLAAALESAGVEAGSGDAGPRMLARDDAAKYVGMGRTKFVALEKAGEIPQRLLIAGRPRWDRRDLDKYIERQRRAQRKGR